MREMCSSANPTSAYMHMHVVVHVYTMIIIVTLLEAVINCMELHVHVCVYFYLYNITDSPNDPQQYHLESYRLRVHSCHSYMYVCKYTSNAQTQRERERERERERDAQTDRQTDRHTHTHTTHSSSTIIIPRPDCPDFHSSTTSTS